jgi:hypothetical protein
MTAAWTTDFRLLAGNERILFQRRQEPSGLFRGRQKPSGFCFEAGRNRAHSVSAPTRTEGIMFQHKNRAHSVSAPTRTEGIMFQHQQEPRAFCFSNNKNRAYSVSATTRTERIVSATRTERIVSAPTRTELILFQHQLAVAQLVDALRYKSEGRGFDSR